MASSSTNGVGLPGNSNRIVLIGQTGTGKTVMGLWHLSNQNLESPWVILNFKDDEHIESIPYTQPIDWTYVPHKKDKGLFVINVLPSDVKRPKLGVKSNLEAYLWEIWKRGNCGIFTDECFMVGPGNDAFDANLTQGRSKRIPMINCTQRPSWISRYCFSEASYIQCFDLIDERDIQTVEGFLPIVWDDEPPLEKHQSFYYDVAQRKLVRFNPCPPMKEINKVFEMKLHRKYVKI